MASEQRSELGQGFEYLQADIRIISDPDGLCVAQHGHAYLARKWRLTPQVRQIIDTALSFGLTHLWQANHPSGSESNHISFSFSHDRESWVFVIGKEAKPPRVECVTFHQKFKAYLKAGGYLEEGGGGEWEDSGGKNIKVKPEYLCSVLSFLPLGDIKAGRLPQYDSRGVIDGKRSYVEKEDALERALDVSFRSHPEVVKVDRQRPFPPNIIGDTASRPDLIPSLEDRVVIVELKVGNSSEADVAQVCRYRSNSALMTAYSHRPLAGVLIASNFQRDAVDAAMRHGVSLYVYDEKENINLTLVSGNDVLPSTLSAL